MSKQWARVFTESRLREEVLTKKTVYALSYRDLSRSTKIPFSSLCKFLHGAKSLSYQNCLSLYNWLGYEVAE